MDNLIIIGAIIFIIVVWVVVRFVAQTAINKGADAIQNARARAQEEKNTARQESLSDRFGNNGSSGN
ncbi:MAG: hypothetical protein IJI40_03340 [Firmicutes bacterium]|nr:hypothetical protein [Bacillota bacterium]MBQ6535795.1 hypothetical protein [Bacillota bacterium]